VLDEYCQVRCHHPHFLVTQVVLRNSISHPHHVLLGAHRSQAPASRCTCLGQL
jgi:hypothetical protein